MLFDKQIFGIDLPLSLSEGGGAPATEGVLCSDCGGGDNASHSVSLPGRAGIGLRV